MEFTCKTARHSTFYTASGPADGPLLILVHGWPELGLSWRHLTPVLSGLGFRCICPDMRGYGRSTIHENLSDYALPELVTDMLELLGDCGARGAGQTSAVWVGHDWGSPVVWSIASHHPEAVNAVCSLNVPYWSLERGLDELIKHVDRSLYPADMFPAGQWEYQKYYQEHFDEATAQHDANTRNTVASLFRGAAAKKVNRNAKVEEKQPSVLAFTRLHGGWFGGNGNEAPSAPRDANVLGTEEEMHTFVSALERNGFRGPNAYYMNHTINATYAARAVNNGVLSMPTLYIGATYDSVCSEGGVWEDSMREKCKRLNVASVASGHWMAQEKPAEVCAILVQWLSATTPELFVGKFATSKL